MTAHIGYEGGLTCAMNVRDLDKATSWYTEKLGFEILYKVDEMGWCEMQTHIDDVQLGLSQVETPEVEGGATLTFGVRDIASARSELESKGVRFDGETLTFPGMVNLATFFDPDGNKLMLFQDLSEQ